MNQKDQIINLRQQGLSYRQIQKRTGANAGKIAYWCSAQVRENRKKRIRFQVHSLKKQCIDYKGGKCSNCNFCAFQSALEFHHINPDFKEFELARMIERRLPIKTIQQELDKCILVCSNCHRGIHNGDIILK